MTLVNLVINKLVANLRSKLYYQNTSSSENPKKVSLKLSKKHRLMCI
jgi:hypothetical protein